MFGLLLLAAVETAQFKKGDPEPDISPVVTIPSEPIAVGITREAPAQQLAVKFQPKLRYPVRALMSFEDYPGSALHNHEEGTSYLTFSIDGGGRVFNCTASGATKTLDDAACNLVMRRARFYLAMASHGEHLAVNASGTVAWKITQAYEDWRDAQQPGYTCSLYPPVRRKPFFARIIYRIFGATHN